MVSTYSLLTLWLSILGFSVELAWGQTTCKKGKDKRPNQQVLWQDDFPIGEEPEALCEGVVSVAPDGEICIDGRVTYEQLEEAVGKPIRAPAYNRISLLGHMVTGSANVVLGTDARFLYDFITKYYIEGVEYAAGPDMVDNLLAASRGLITGVCLNKNFAQEPELYSVTHDFWLAGSAKEKLYTDASVIYIGSACIVAEYWKPSNVGPYFGTITNTLSTWFAGLVPSFIPRYLPILGLTGIFRGIVIGSMSTSQFPQALVAPDFQVEDVQIDTDWDGLMAAMRDGLFTKDRVPLYFGVLIKKITPAQNTYGCWKNDTAAIDIQAPKFRGDQLDKYVKETVLPYLKARGKVALHFGKRLDSGSDVYKSALYHYNTECNVQLDLSPTRCYHPACQRKPEISGFEYPQQFYQDAKRRLGAPDIE